ncbi:MAG TPA: hypothetical protein VM388_13675 [Acidimicrobiales bacterium]|nr:hypothetical protein [Acidimicrobiales bacterium]
MGRLGLALVAAATLSACTHGPPPPPPATPEPSAVLPSVTAAPPVGGRGLDRTDRLERQHRLAQALPHDTPHYRIDFTVAADGRLALRVTLLAVLNQARDLPAYQAELARYRAEALAFIAAQGDDPATYTVTFLPPDQPTSPKEGP